MDEEILDEGSFGYPFCLATIREMKSVAIQNVELDQMSRGYRFFLALTFIYQNLFGSIKEFVVYLYPKSNNMKKQWTNKDMWQAIGVGFVLGVLFEAIIIILKTR